MFKEIKQKKQQQNKIEGKERKKRNDFNVILISVELVFYSLCVCTFFPHQFLQFIFLILLSFVKLIQFELCGPTKKKKNHCLHEFQSIIPLGIHLLYSLLWLFLYHFLSSSFCSSLSLIFHSYKAFAIDSFDQIKVKCINSNMFLCT